MNSERAKASQKSSEVASSIGEKSMAVKMILYLEDLPDEDFESWFLIANKVEEIKAALKNANWSILKGNGKCTGKFGEHNENGYLLKDYHSSNSNSCGHW